MNILDGRSVRDRRKKDLISYVQNLKLVPTLAIIQVGEDGPSSAYIEQKKIFGESIGARVLHKKMPQNSSHDDIEEVIARYNSDNEVHGIIVQLPLPKNLDAQKIIDCIDPDKDVDGLTSHNVEKLKKGEASFVPATARGIYSLLKAYEIPVKDKKVTVVGRSKLVGGPIAHLLEKEGAEVTVCHSKTENIPEKTKQADILIVATGHPHLITEEYVSEGQVVVDVGINLATGEPALSAGRHFDEEVPGKKYIGDVDFDAVSEKMAYISPVPGGVGPMTVLSLFENLIDAYKLCNNMS